MQETLFRGSIVELLRLDGRWEVVRHAAAVAVLAVRDGRVLAVRQRRPAIDADTWELPAGMIDPGETPEQAAHRELAEEAQLGGKLTFITWFYTSPGFTDELVHLFEASELAPAEGEPDELEELELAWLDPLDLWREVQAGKVHTSGVTLLGLQRVLARMGALP